MTPEPTIFNTKNSPSHIGLLLVLVVALLAGCGEPPWNNPHPPAPDGQLTYQSMMASSPPKHLDPAISYASDEALYINIDGDENILLEGVVAQIDPDTGLDVAPFKLEFQYGHEVARGAPSNELTVL